MEIIVWENVSVIFCPELAYLKLEPHVRAVSYIADSSYRRLRPQPRGLRVSPLDAHKAQSAAERPLQSAAILVIWMLFQRQTTETPNNLKYILCAYVRFLLTAPREALLVTHFQGLSGQVSAHGVGLGKEHLLGDLLGSRCVPLLAEVNEVGCYS